MEANICPYCGEEMQLGYFGGVYHQLEWIPEGIKQRKTILTKPTGIPLNKPSIFKFHKVEAYYCNRCGIVLIHKNNI